MHEKQPIVSRSHKLSRMRLYKKLLKNSLGFRIIKRVEKRSLFKSVELIGPARARYWRAAVRNLKNPNLVPPSKMFLTNQNGGTLYLFIER